MRRTFIAAAFTNGVLTLSLRSGGFARSLTRSEVKEEWWWSQRDLNPCLSLERTDGSEENQQDDDLDVSDE
jgi:hypothetical protein